MLSGGRLRSPLVGVVALLAMTAPCGAQTPLPGAAERPVRWTADERLYHGDARLAPRFACNTHLAASAPKDSSRGGCTLLKIVCDMGLGAACARLAPYKPDFHNIERARREASILDMSTYTALHRASPPSPLVRNGRPHVAAVGPSAPLERKVYGGGAVR